MFNATFKKFQLSRGGQFYCAKYSDVLDRSQLPIQELLKQGYVAPRLK
jgi:hypothetical protein